MLKAPFPWFGGKARASELVWKHLGADSPNFVEPFAGSIACLLGRPVGARPTGLETVNDKDGYIVNAWRALQGDPAGVARYADYPVHELDLHARHRWLVTSGKKRIDRLRTDPGFYDVKVAGWWIWEIALWIGSGWCYKPEWEGRFGGGQSRRNGNRRGSACTADSMQRPKLDHARFSENPYAQCKRPQLGSARGPHQILKIPKLMAPGAVHQIPTLTASRGIQTGRREWILDWFGTLSERLRNVRVCCGDWKRVVTPAVTWKIGGSMRTAVLLDPPYATSTGRDPDIYSHDSGTIAHDVRAWAIANGNNRLMRIALCGLEGEHEMPEGWFVKPWKAGRGYSMDPAAGTRERIWFSPYCLRYEHEAIAKGILRGAL